MWTTVRAAVVIAACVAGCATAPETKAERDELGEVVLGTRHQPVDGVAEVIDRHGWLLSQVGIVW